MWYFEQESDKLILTLGWSRDSNIPQETREVTECPLDPARYCLDGLAGLKVDNWRGNVGVCWRNERPVQIDTTDWPRRLDVRPVPQPKDKTYRGEKYAYTWEYGRWVCYINGKSFYG